MDKKALKLLCKRGELSPEEEAYCTEKGVLTAIEPMEHDTFIRKIKEAAGAVTHEKAVKGFLYSISTGDFRYRTALSALSGQKLCLSTAVKKSPLTTADISAEYAAGSSARAMT